MKKLIALLLSVCLLALCGVSFAADKIDMPVIGFDVDEGGKTTVTMFYPGEQHITGNDLDVKADGASVGFEWLPDVPTTWVFLLDTTVSWGKNQAASAKKFVDGIANRMDAGDNGIVVDAGVTISNAMDLKLVGKGSIQDTIDDFAGKATDNSASGTALEVIKWLPKLDGRNARVCLVILSTKNAAEKGNWGTLSDALAKEQVGLYAVLFGEKKDEAVKSFENLPDTATGGRFIKVSNAADDAGTGSQQILTNESRQIIRIVIDGEAFNEKVPQSISIVVKGSNPQYMASCSPDIKDRSKYPVPEEPEQPDELGIEPEPEEEFDPLTWWNGLDMQYKIIAGLGLVLLILIIILVIKSANKKKSKKKEKNEPQPHIDPIPVTSVFSNDHDPDDGETEPIFTPMGGQYRLELRQKNTNINYSAMISKKLIVGRSKEKANLVVYPEDKKISGMNCEFELAPDGSLMVKDLGSTNGTYVNGVRIMVKTPVQNGAVIRMGMTEFEVNCFRI